MANLEAFYLPLAHGHRFCLLHTPVGGVTSSGAVLYVHPFAEEMNKSRRMAALQARALADAGWTVLQMDLYGCGDSPGEFADATWERWIEDVTEAARWLEKHVGHPPVFWGLRTGCLLVTEAARRLEQVTHLLLWQPILSGRQFLQQFLRLKLASQIGAEGAQRTGTQALLDQLASGQVIEVAGYTLAPGVTIGMQAAELLLPHSQARVGWLEVAGSPDSEIPASSRAVIEAWRAAGRSVDAVVASGPRFWQTVEICESPELLAATAETLLSWRG